ncbi:MAG: class I SAM-dependent methyltransferase [Sporichthyaceae bacterium]|nr:class I SAM-dependent methyltransferase [Sporichthyaceae bacterium]
MSKYDTEVDLENAGTSHALIVDLVGHNKTVLDVGCSTGYLARVLREQGCKVSGAEIDPAAAAEAEEYLEKVVVDDLDTMDLVDAFSGETFDAVVFGDVLEHLRDPLPTLRQARKLLSPGGSVIVSVPNVAHGAVRLALLRGKFPYRPLGLLDSTHLRFFTRDGLEDLMREAGLVMVDTRRSVAGIFETELGIEPEDYDPVLVHELEDDLDATTYQFVVRAVRDDGDQAVRDMYERGRARDLEIHQLERAVARATAEAAAATERVAEAERRAAAAEAEVSALTHTLTIRSMRVPRALYSRLRGLR